MSMRFEHEEFNIDPDEDPHSMTLRAVNHFEMCLGFLPSMRDLIWWTGEHCSVSTMHQRFQVLETEGQLQAINNPRTNQTVGYRTT